MTVLHRIITLNDWVKAKRFYAFKRSAIDVESGFTHLSAHHQTRETLKRYFSPKQHPLVLEISIASLGVDLKWEHVSSRGEAMPHLYRSLRFDDLLGIRHVTFQTVGIHIGPLRSIESD